MTITEHTRLNHVLHHDMGIVAGLFNMRVVSGYAKIDGREQSAILLGKARADSQYEVDPLPSDLRIELARIALQEISKLPVVTSNFVARIY